MKTGYVIALRETTRLYCSFDLPAYVIMWLDCNKSFSVHNKPKDCSCLGIKKELVFFFEQRVKKQKINNCGCQSSHGKWHALPQELSLKLLSKGLRSSFSS